MVAILNMLIRCDLERIWPSANLISFNFDIVTYIFVLLIKNPSPHHNLPVPFSLKIDTF